jgi:hypothetical protein
LYQRQGGLPDLTDTEAGVREFPGRADALGVVDAERAAAGLDPAEQAVHLLARGEAEVDPFTQAPDVGVAAVGGDLFAGDEEERGIAPGIDDRHVGRGVVVGDGEEVEAALLRKAGHLLDGVRAIRVLGVRVEVAAVPAGRRVAGRGGGPGRTREAACAHATGNRHFEADGEPPAKAILRDFVAAEDDRPGARRKRAGDVAWRGGCAFDEELAAVGTAPAAETAGVGLGTADIEEADIERGGLIRGGDRGVVVGDFDAGAARWHLEGHVGVGVDEGLGPGDDAVEVVLLAHAR